MKYSLLFSLEIPHNNRMMKNLHVTAEQAAAILEIGAGHITDITTNKVARRRNRRIGLKYKK